MACCRGDKFKTDFRPLHQICRDAIIEMANAMNIVVDFTEINEGKIDVIFKKNDGIMTRKCQVTIAMCEFHNSKIELSDYIDRLQELVEKKLSFSYDADKIKEDWKKRDAEFERLITRSMLNSFYGSSVWSTIRDDILNPYADAINNYHKGGFGYRTTSVAIDDLETAKYNYGRGGFTHMNFDFKNSNCYKKIIIERCLKKFAREHNLTFGMVAKDDDGRSYILNFGNPYAFKYRTYVIDLNECDDYMKTISVIENAILHSDLIEKGATMPTNYYQYFGVPARGLGRTYWANPVPRIEKVIFNNPATIVMWGDGTKTVVKAQGEAFDEEKGLAMAIAKKALGNEGNYYETIKKHLPKIEDK